MELSELDISPDRVKEVSRFRIPAPAPDTSYCEKNWMPIVDKPFHYVKWSNPTEVVRVDTSEVVTTTTHLGSERDLSHDLRAGLRLFHLRMGILRFNMLPISIEQNNNVRTQPIDINLRIGIKTGM